MDNAHTCIHEDNGFLRHTNHVYRVILTNSQHDTYYLNNSNIDTDIHIFKEEGNLYIYNILVF